MFSRGCYGVRGGVREVWCLQGDVWCESDWEVKCFQEDAMVTEGVQGNFGVYKKIYGVRENNREV